MALRSRIVAATAALLASCVVHATQCGTANYPFPYTDVVAVGDAFCPGIMEAYVLGVTEGTTATTFTPNQDVPRLQMTTFLQRSFDQSTRRASRRAALGQWWTPRSAASLQSVTLVGGPAFFCRSDGERVWVPIGGGVVRVQAANGELLQALSVPAPVAPGAMLAATAIVLAAGEIHVSDSTYGGVTSARYAYSAGDVPTGGFPDRATPVDTPFVPNTMAFDGDRLWTANYGDGSVAFLPFPIAAGNFTAIAGFSQPVDVVFDGASIWVAEQGGVNRIRRLDGNGNPVQSVPTGVSPGYMAFDGANIWVPNTGSNSISVVRASTGAVVATIASTAANGLNQPLVAAFDGERMLVTNAGNDSVTVFRAADLSLIRHIPLPAGSFPFGACSDGVDFWVVLRGTNRLLRV